MKVRCPSCGYIADKLPPSLKCPTCDDFSHDWLIYDWESFCFNEASTYWIQPFNYWVIALIVLLATIISKSTDASHWLFSLLFIPAVISLFNCLKQLRRESEYEGHKGRALIPWFNGFGGF